ncbi:hypothetical protein, partial [Stenotrophomonas sp. Ste71]|uniref:hypothetical protein n=1 Tax=Stenotrophomonas sp. Ste71 TaxID=2926027 RepID=UPI00211962A3
MLATVANHFKPGHSRAFFWFLFDCGAFFHAQECLAGCANQPSRAGVCGFAGPSYAMDGVR